MRSKYIFMTVSLLLVLYVNVYAGAEVTLTIGEGKAPAGVVATVPVSISDATKLAGGDFTIVYDYKYLKIKQVDSTPLSKVFSPTINTKTIGTIIIAMASVKGLQSGTGLLFNIKFTVDPLAEEGKEALIEFKKGKIYDDALQEIPVSLQNGKVTVAPPCLRGDVNGDGEVDSRDAILALRIIAELIVATPQQKCAADVTGDAKIMSNDAIKILRMIAGLEAPGRYAINSGARTVTIALDEVYSAATKSITTLVKLNNIDSVSGGDICLVYDSSVLRVVDILSESNILLESNISESGIVRLAFASSDKLNSNTIARVKFDIISNSVSPITLQKAVLYNSDGFGLNISNPITKLVTSWGNIKRNN